MAYRCFLMSRRVFAVAVVCLLLLLALIGRLFSLQIVHGEQLAAAGLAQRSRTVPVAPARGQIRDRHGLPLVAPALRLDLVLFPGSDADPESVAALLSRTIGLDEAAVVAAFGQAEPVVLRAGLTAAEAAQAQAVARAVPGLLVVARHERDAGQALAPHVLGQLQDGEAAGSGLEAAFDRFLRGDAPPVVAAFVDGNNRLIPGLRFTYRERPDDAGFDVYLTLSAPWQAAAEEALAAAGVPGAAVVIDVATGDILALASAPAPPVSYLPRAVLAYTPGSLFHTVVLAAALEHGLTRLDDAWGDAGITVQEAFAASDGDLFAELGVALGAARLIDAAQAFGLGRQHGIGLPGEEAGALPDAASVGPGDVRQLGNGQGPVTVTPLQAAGIVAALGNGGTLPPLQLVREVRSGDGLVVWRPPAARPAEVTSAAAAYQLRQALLASADADPAVRIDGVAVAGRAGAAEAFHPGTGEPLQHGWYAGLAELPRAHGARRLAVAVFLEETTNGSGSAAPVFADLLERALGMR